MPTRIGPPTSPEPSAGWSSAVSAGREPGGTGSQVPYLHRHRAECPLLRAAIRSGDPTVAAAMERFHPPAHCPAARKERAA